MIIVIYFNLFFFKNLYNLYMQQSNNKTPTSYRDDKPPKFIEPRNESLDDHYELP